MRRVIPCVVLAGLVGCGSADVVTRAEQQTVRAQVERHADPACVDTLAFTRWESATVEEAGQPVKVVRAKFVCDRAGKRVNHDRLFKLKASAVVAVADNRAADDWKKGVEKQRWPE